ncbi:MAG: hypothetical protein ACFFCW_13900 [Candidatus Hodarchaeota archaeon]
MERKMTLEQRRNWLLDFLNCDLDGVLPAGIIDLLYERKLFEDPYSETTPRDIIKASPDIEAARAELKKDQDCLRKGLVRVIEAKDIEAEGVEPEDVGPFWNMGPVEIYRYKAGGEVIENYRFLDEQMDTDDFRLNHVLGEILQDSSPYRFAQCSKCPRFIYVKSKKNRGDCKSCSNKITTQQWRSIEENREAERIQRKLRHSGIKKGIEEIRKEIRRKKRKEKN